MFCSVLNIKKTLVEYNTERLVRRHCNEKIPRVEEHMGQKGKPSPWENHEA